MNYFGKKEKEMTHDYFNSVDTSSMQDACHI